MGIGIINYGVKCSCKKSFITTITHSRKIADFLRLCILSNDIVHRNILNRFFKNILNRNTNLSVKNTHIRDMHKCTRVLIQGKDNTAFIILADCILLHAPRVRSMPRNHASLITMIITLQLFVCSIVCSFDEGTINCTYYLHSRGVYPRYQALIPSARFRSKDEVLNADVEHLS